MEKTSKKRSYMTVTHLKSNILGCSATNKW